MADDCERFLFIWRIENFSLCDLGTSKIIASPTFRAESQGGSEWYINLYPKGTEEAIGYISCFLNRTKNDDSEMTDYELEIVDDDNEVIVSYGRVEKVFKNSWGYREFIAIDELNEKMKNWKKDVLTVRCYMKNYSKSLKQPIHTIEALTTIGVNQYCFEWNAEIHNTESSDWKPKRNIFIEEYSHFEFSLSEKNDGILISILRLGEENSRSVFVSCKISLLDLKGIEVKSKTAKHLFLKENVQSWDFPIFFSKKDLLDRSKELILNDTFTLKCEVSASKGEMVSEIKKVKYDDPSSSDSKPIEDSMSVLRDDLRKMLKAQKNSDVKLRVSSIVIPAHKFILSARSPVFSAMFDQDMLENQTGIVDIQDVDITTLDYLLEFIYTGVVEDLDFANAMKLLVAADKYQIPSLIEMCVDVVKTELSVENVCDVYSAADMVNHKRLKLCALEFVETNREKVLSSDTWPVWMEENVKLANEILFKLAISSN